MPGYTMTPRALGGILLSTFGTAYWDGDDPSPMTTPQAVDVVEAVIPGRGSELVRAQPRPQTWLMTFETANTLEVDLSSVNTIFDPTKGLQYLILRDDNTKDWRVAVQVISRPQRVAPNIWKVPLRVPNPVLEESTPPAADQKLNQNSSPVSINITPAGIVETPPTFTIKPNAVKDNILEHRKWSFRGFIVNRTQDDWNDLPVYLCDQSGAKSRIATNSSASGPTVRHTTGATTITSNISAGASTINLTDASAWPARGMGFITDARGNGFHDQFYYTGKSSNQLTGVVWLPAAARGRTPGGTLITGGGIAHTTAQVSSIAPSALLLSGDDVGVWLDDAKQRDEDVHLVNWDSASSDIVVNVTMPARRTRTILETVTASVPATGGALTFGEGVADLADQGVMVVGDEVIAWRGRDVRRRQVTNIVRAYYGSTAASHGTGATADLSVRLVTVGAGWAKAPPVLRPLSRRPAIQLPGSDNQGWKWGGTSNDPNTVFFDSINPDRPARWRPGFDLDGNAVSPLMQISQSTSPLTFKDDAPGDGGSPYNFAEIVLPQGIKAGDAYAWKADWAPAAEIINLELFTRDASGRYVLKDELQQTAPVLERQLPAGLGAVAVGVKLKGRYNIVTGYRGRDSLITEIIQNQSNDVDAPGTVAFGFTLSHQMSLRAIVARMAKATAGTQQVRCHIYPDANGAPDTAAAAIAILGAQTISGTTPAFYRWDMGQRAVTMPGSYWALFYMASGFAPVNVYGSGVGATASDYTRSVLRTATEEWQATSSRDMWVYVIGDYDVEGNARLEPDQPVLDFSQQIKGVRTGVTASFGRAEMTADPAWFPRVHRFGGFAAGLYHNTAEIKRTAPTAQAGITLDLWMALAATLVINCDARTLTYTESGVAKQVPHAAIVGAWPTLVPGAANTITYTEPGITSTDITTAHRGRRV